MRNKVEKLHVTLVACKNPWNIIATSKDFPSLRQFNNFDQLRKQEFNSNMEKEAQYFRAYTKLG